MLDLLAAGRIREAEVVVPHVRQAIAFRAVVAPRLHGRAALTAAAEPGRVDRR